MKWLLVAIVVATTTVGEVMQAMGMKHHGEIHDFSPTALGRVLATLTRNRYILISFLAMAFSFFAFMALISVADLSFAVPATAASYVMETILAKVFLKEHIGFKRWAGALLVTGGVTLLSM